MAGTTEDRLLPGEDPATPDLEDAQLWARSTTEMIMVKLDLITRLDGHVAALSGPAQTELETIDQTMIRDHQVARFERRPAYWEFRTRELKQGSSEAPGGA